MLIHPRSPFNIYVFYSLDAKIFLSLYFRAFGLVTKNGILIVEFANQNRLKGMGKAESVIYASSQRLRPILMTSLAMSLGALPIAISLGAAATSRIPLGIVIVGGIMFSLVLTLFVVPAMYSYMSSKKKRNELDIMEDEQKKIEKAQLVH